MLPDFDECRRIMGLFEQQVGQSRFNHFWQYKVHTEKHDGSILDDNNLAVTAAKLTDMLNGWGRMGRTGVANGPSMVAVLSSLRGHYTALRPVTLGSGQMTRVRDSVESAYASLIGVTNRDNKGDTSPDLDLYVTGKSKALMLLWGQTPAFDAKVRKQMKRAPESDRLNVAIGERCWSPSKFADVLVKLDEWVRVWSENNGGSRLQDVHPLVSELPVGRIVDILYWTDQAIDHLHQCER